MMLEKIKYRLQQSWSSLYGGVDLNEAANKLDRLFIEEIHDAVEKNNLHHKLQLKSISDISDSFEINMEDSNRLLVEVLPELNRLKNIDSNNPNKLVVLSNLIYRIEEQIIENGK